MGIFGGSPGKKLEKARRLAERGDLYEALVAFEEAAEARGLGPEEREEARSGALECRRRMIDRRLEEAEALRLAGDLAGARDRCVTALDLAGDALDHGPIEEVRRRIDAPRRPLVPRVGGTDPEDLPPSGDEAVSLRPTPLDRGSRNESEPEPGEEEILGDDPAALFEVHLHTLDADTATLFRSLGDDFRAGYLALTQGYGRRALEAFGRLDWERIEDPRIRIERAQALLLAGDGEGTLAELERIESEGPEMPEGARRSLATRRRYLRIESLRVLGRFETALEEARGLAAEEGKTSAAGILLAWTLLEAGKAEEAYGLLQERMSLGDDEDETLILAATAARGLGLPDEEIGLLETVINRRVLQSAESGREVEFPVEAGRRLLDLYLERSADPVAVRGLALHLIDHDPERGEAYRDVLLHVQG